MRSAEAGMPVRDVCLTYGISAATFYRWKRRCSGPRGETLDRARSLEAEVRRLAAVVTRQERELDGLRTVIAGNC